jgi:hypothetical protein
VRNNAEENRRHWRARIRQQQISPIGLRCAARQSAARAPAAPSTPAPLTALPAAPRQGQQIAQLTIVGQINMDSKAVGTAVYPTIAVLIDDELSASLALLNPPGSGQAAGRGGGLMPWSFQGQTFAVVADNPIFEEWFASKTERTIDVVLSGSGTPRRYVDIGGVSVQPLPLSCNLRTRGRPTARP